jgi:hypothetical protein
MLSLFFFNFLGAMVVIQIEVDKAAAVARWVRSTEARLSWSFSSATKFWELKSLAMESHFRPGMISGKNSTSTGRPFWSSGVEGLVRLEASGSVPVSSHGCSELISDLHRGEEKGLDCFLRFFSRVFSTNARDPYVISEFYGILCNSSVLPLLRGCSDVQKKTA